MSFYMEFFQFLCTFLYFFWLTLSRRMINTNIATKTKQKLRKVIFSKSKNTKVKKYNVNSPWSLYFLLGSKIGFAVFFNYIVNSGVFSGWGSIRTYSLISCDNKVVCIIIYFYVNRYELHLKSYSNVTLYQSVRNN